MNWKHRIEVALEKAAEGVANGEKYINRSEIALATALSEPHVLHNPPHDCKNRPMADAGAICAALCTFVKKVEVLCGYEYQSASK